jgi:hypothetical protein
MAAALQRLRPLTFDDVEDFETVSKAPHFKGFAFSIFHLNQLHSCVG